MNAPSEVTLLGLVRAGLVGQMRRMVTLAVVVAFSAGAVALGLCLGSYASDVSEAGVSGEEMRTVDVYAMGGDLTESVVSDFRSRPGVAEVKVSVEAGAALLHTGSPVTMVGTTGARPPMVDGTWPAGGLTGDEVVLPASVEEVPTDDLVGSATQLEYTQVVGDSLGRARERSVTVLGTYDSTYQVDGPAAVYASSDLVVGLAAARAGVDPSQFLDEVGYSRVRVLAKDADSVDQVTSSLQEDGFHAVSVAQRLEEVPGVIALVRAVTVALFVVLVVISMVASLAVGRSIAGERAVEVATLKAFGWRPRRLVGLHMAEAGIVVAAAALTGALVGALLGVTVGGAWRDDLTSGQVGEVQMPVELNAAYWLALVLLVSLAYGGSVVRVARRPVVSVFRDAL